MDFIQGGCEEQHQQALFHFSRTMRDRLARYVVFRELIDPGIISILGGSRSCQSYCGYHNNVGKVYYAVMPYPSCSGCLGGLQTFDALTATSSHELCEAVTDPIPGAGWYDDTKLAEASDLGFVTAPSCVITSLAYRQTGASKNDPWRLMTVNTASTVAFR